MRKESRVSEELEFLLKEVEKLNYFKLDSDLIFINIPCAFSIDSEQFMDGNSFNTHIHLVQ